MICELCLNATKTHMHANTLFFIILCTYMSLFLSYLLPHFSLPLEHTFTHKYREYVCVCLACFCSCVWWLREWKAQAVCVYVCKMQKGTPPVAACHRSLMGNAVLVGTCVWLCPVSVHLSRQACFLLGRGKIKVTSFGKAKEGNPGRAQTEWTLTSVVSAACYSLLM